MGATVLLPWLLCLRSIQEMEAAEKKTERILSDDIFSIANIRNFPKRTHTPWSAAGCCSSTFLGVPYALQAWKVAIKRHVMSAGTCKNRPRYPPGRDSVLSLEWPAISNGIHPPSPTDLFRGKGNQLCPLRRKPGYPPCVEAA